MVPYWDVNQASWRGSATPQPQNWSLLNWRPYLMRLIVVHDFTFFIKTLRADLSKAVELWYQLNQVSITSMADIIPHPRVGVAAIIRNSRGELVVGERKSTHGAGTWQFPGGHLEFGEGILACAERETMEETGLEVKGIKLITTTNDVFDEEKKHYITLFVLCEMVDPGAEPRVMEPDKCACWHWIRWEDVRSWCLHHDDYSPEWRDLKCFLPLRNLVKDNLDLRFDASDMMGGQRP